MLFLGFDVGTTCCKCQLFNEKGDILFYDINDYGLKIGDDNKTYVNITAIVVTLKEQIRKAAAQGDIASIAVSSLGESFVLLDHEDNILLDPMLYTDIRGKDQAELLKKKFGTKKLFDITGVVPHAMYSVSKLLWLRTNLPNVFQKVDKVMLIGEYVGYILTKNRVIDYGLASRTGVFDVCNKRFSEEILSEIGLPLTLFSKPRPAGSMVGEICKETAEELGLSKHCKLILGSHDQICATLGAGVLDVGEVADGMGTVECVTAVFQTPPEESKFGSMGYPVVPYAVDGLYCTYILNYSCGSLVNWFRKTIMHGFSGEKSDFFEYMEERLPQAQTDAILLPYFSGAATPFQDSEARGAIIGLDLSVTDAQLYRAILEGTTFEMRLNFEMVKPFGIEIKKLVATGGGSNSAEWLQIKSNILNAAIDTLRSSEGGLCGLAMLQAVAAGTAKNLEHAREIFVRKGRKFSPDPVLTKGYENKYAKYKKLYKTIKAL